MIKQFLIAFSVLLVSVNVFSQIDDNIRYFKKSEKIIVHDTNSGFSIETRLEGITGDKYDYIPIYYNPLTRYSDLSLSIYNYHGHLRKKRRPDIERSLVISPYFHTDDSVILVRIAPNTRFVLTYKSYCKELFLLSPLFLKSTNIMTDTLFYDLQIPNHLHLSYDTCNNDSSIAIMVDTIYREESRSFEFTSIAGYEEKTKSNLLLEEDEAELPIIRVIITPKRFIGKEHEYFNNWYLDIISDSTILNEEAKEVVDKLTQDIVDPDSIARKVFIYVRNNIKYIDIFYGAGAYVPNSIGHILHTKQGDCKDMSNLMCQCLKYKGLDARMAVASTFGHISDMDHPSVASGNHVVCAYYLDSSWTVLDATEKSGIPGYPPLSLQNRHIFITGDDGGQFYKMEPLPPDSNKIIRQIDLNINESGTAGSFQFDYHGLSAVFYKDAMREMTSRSTDVYFKVLLEEIGAGLIYDNINYSNTEKTFEIHGDVTLPASSFFTDRENGYLLLNFLPFPLRNTNEKNGYYSAGTNS